jgi:hypothetical protein
MRTYRNLGDTCQFWSAATGWCKATPSRLYPAGRRCAEHTPAKLAGRAEDSPDFDRTLDGLRAKLREQAGG